jgi:hypothetical protein
MIGDPGRRIGRAVRNSDAVVERAADSALSGRRTPLTINPGAALNELATAFAARPPPKTTTSRSSARAVFATNSGFVRHLPVFGPLCAVVEDPRYLNGSDAVRERMMQLA